MSDDMFEMPSEEFPPGFPERPFPRGRSGYSSRGVARGPVKPQSSLERDYAGEAEEALSHLEEEGGVERSTVNIDPRNPLSGVYVILSRIYLVLCEIKNRDPDIACESPESEGSRSGGMPSDRVIVQEVIKVMEELSSSLRKFVEESQTEKANTIPKEPDDPSLPVTNKNFIEGLDRNFNALLRAVEKKISASSGKNGYSFLHFFLSVFAGGIGAAAAIAFFSWWSKGICFPG